MIALRYLLDTNICTYIVKRRPEGVARKFEALSPGELGMSVVTYGELRYGASKSRGREAALSRLDRLRELVAVLPLSPEVGERYGEIRAALERQGTPIGNKDLWIAAHALASGLTLVTHDTAELARVPGLSIEDWA